MGKPGLYIQTRCTQPKTQPEYDFDICSVQGKHESAPVGHSICFYSLMLLLRSPIQTKTKWYMLVPIRILCCMLWCAKPLCTVMFIPCGLRNIINVSRITVKGRLSVESSSYVAAYEDPREACSAIAAESYKLWLEHENRTDDITIIIVHIRDSENPGPAGSQKMNGSSLGAPIALRTGQPELPVYVPSEASHLNRDAATEMPSSSSGSPTEQHLSCVAPSPTHPLLGVGRTSETAKLIESERAGAVAVRWLWCWLCRVSVMHRWQILSVLLLVFS
uniref:Uncharacterized protein n=1 Tax=Oryza barthii TaxID=65489 RepID=A0A0D3GU85_9ORYZ